MDQPDRLKATADDRLRPPPAPRPRDMALVAQRRAARRRTFRLLVMGILVLAVCVCPLGIAGRTLLSTRYSDKPLEVNGLRDVTAIAAGEGFSLALTRDGTVWAWGSNNHGQLGIGGGGDRSSPARVPLSGRATAIAAGVSTGYAVTDDGAIWAWGDNYFGRLGTTAIPAGCVGQQRLQTYTDFSARPVRVEGLGGVTAVAAGDTHTLALTATGEVWAWGGNKFGQSGESSSSCFNVYEDRSYPFVGIPQRITLPFPATAIAVGDKHSLALVREPSRQGVVWAWGSAEFHQLGYGSSAPRPTRVDGLGDVRAIGGGAEGVSLAITQGASGQDSVWFWGKGYGNMTCRADYGWVEKPTFPCSATPVKVNGIPGAMSVAARTSYVLDSTPPWPTRYWDTGSPPASSAIFKGAIRYLDAAALVVATDGQLWYWDSGRTAGQGTVTARALGFGGVRAVATSRTHYLALRNDGTVWTWGLNGDGALGR